MSPSRLAVVRERDRIRKAAKRREDDQAREIHRRREALRRQQLSPDERCAQRQQNSVSRVDQRRELSDEQRQMIQDNNTLARATARRGMNDEQRRVIQDRDAFARAFQRNHLSQEQRQDIRGRDADARASSRRLMTLDERLDLVKKSALGEDPYKAGYGNHEDFDPASVRGNDISDRRHYVSRFIRGCSGDERTCVDCGAWKFPGETKKCCCMGGGVRLPPPREAPEKLRLLFNNPVFMQSIRVYNNAFAFTSMGASRSEPLQVDECVTRRGVYNFRVMGTVCHQMGSLIPPPPIYISNPDSAARMASRIRMTDGLSAEILSDIDEVMEQNNPYAQQFLHAREILIERSRPALEMARADRAQRQENEGKQEEDVHDSLIDPEVECILRLHVGQETNPGTHNTPTASEVAAIIIDANAAQPRDIILYARQGGFNRIYETNPHYDPLQYPLLHPYRESGWTYKISYTDEQNNNNNDQRRRSRVGNDQTDQNLEGDLAEWGYIVQYEDSREERRKPTMSLTEFVAYLLYDRTGSHLLLLLGGRLTQQYCVDQWAKAEQERLRYFVNNQLEFRLETIQGLTDAYRHESTEAHRTAAVHELQQYARDSAPNRGRVSDENVGLDANTIGRRLILPPSFTGVWRSG
ncbi:LOW QUALITY PROTEIN: Helitron helicase-like protein [Phytophthora palmivora]|uniref:Helitron helicase-like protein n=1 Tax=Phytophthora palmivora TaxID=4796 RepID=A0A2P4YM81_9STRA|nr:LOW QUALITY PROTEIN: Helitron helicase-like protein [Phytophthora palmivora]